MSAKDYDEEWEEIKDGPIRHDIFARIKEAISSVADEENRFEPYDLYRVQDTFDPNSFHYIVRIYAGRNGCGEWVSYLQDMTNIFNHLLQHDKPTTLSPPITFSKIWLIEWRNRCADDISAALVAFRL